MQKAIVQYSYLQVLDLLTTVAFLLLGVQEGNPLVRVAMTLAPSPVVGLMAMKLAAMMLGLYCWQSNKDRLLWKINTMFAIVVAWNMVVLIVGASGVIGSR